MNYAMILAGGSGTRMGNTSVPKQYMELNGKPILIHTLEKFVCHEEVDRIIIVVPDSWFEFTQSILSKYHLDSDNIFVVSGGENRNETILKGCRFIQSQEDYAAADIVVTHDAVRPFLTHRIISDNIHAVSKGYAVDTVISAIDTIISSENGVIIDAIPERKAMFQGQTPQSFLVGEFIDLYLQSEIADLAILSDACKLFLMNGRKVKIVLGDQANIKITTLFDFQLAESIIEVRHD